MKKVSVIIPVYNVEEYLAECIESVLNQTYMDFELILVNDGSKDKSGEICDRYALNDSRINVIHKENGGLSDARNFGLENANGEYILFLDSDDFLVETALEDTIYITEKGKCDFIFFDALSFNDKNRDYNIKQNYVRNNDYPVKSGLETLGEQLKNKEYHTSACMMLIKTELLKNCAISFFKGILYEDLLFTFMVYAKADKVGQLKKSIYHRRYRNESIMTSKPGKRNFQSAVTILHEAVGFSEEEQIYSEVAVKKYLSKCAYKVINVYEAMNVDDRKNAKSDYLSAKEYMRENDFFGDTSLQMRCKGKLFWFVYKVITKIFRVK